MGRATQGAPAQSAHRQRHIDRTVYNLCRIFSKQSWYTARHTQHSGCRYRHMDHHRLFLLRNHSQRYFAQQNGAKPDDTGRIATGTMLPFCGAWITLCQNENQNRYRTRISSIWFVKAKQCTPANAQPSTARISVCPNISGYNWVYINATSANSGI